MPVNRSSAAPAWAPYCRFDRDADPSEVIAGSLLPRLKPGIGELIDAFRHQGHRLARLDPLQALDRPVSETAPVPPALADFGLSDSAPVAEDGAAVLGAGHAEALHQRLREVYCGTVALDVSAVRDETRRQWLRARMESMPAPLDTAPASALLTRLAGVEGWERYLSRRFPHGKRFSLEGNEALLPLLDAALSRAASQGVDRCFMGMPHRGRVNVLVNLLGHPVDEIIDYFEPAPAHPERQRDLVYHLGGRYEVQTPSRAVTVTMASNPSHLQSVYPVVVGMARAARSAAGAQADRCLPIVMHGDAAFAGQGVVMETLALGLKPGYEVGGVLHIIINNQLGFTEPNRMDLAQSRFCTDPTRMIDAPVLRVSADDPEAVLRVAALAVDYRARFGADVVIDLVGYRRLGHSEHDEPMFTAPGLYRRVPHLPGVTAIYAQRLVKRGALSVPETLAAMGPLDGFDERGRISAGRRVVECDIDIGAAAGSTAIGEAAPLPGRMPDAAALRGVLGQLAGVPEGFEPHPALARLAARWRTLAAGQGDETAGGALDWCSAEAVAHALILSAGVPLRISGLDVQRGTFLHRHAVWHNQAESGPATWMPLSGFGGDTRLEIHNSLLSEEAVLGFEYGHSVEAADTLTVWEAQFGDFVNGAQVFLDQYISCGEEKWGYESGLTVLLPHGYEGVGPEHSNGFLARLLQLCGADNLRVAYPSTAGQYAQLLLRQALSPVRKPLMVMTPKAVLLNEARSHTPVDVLAGGRFEPVLDDADVAPQAVRRLLLCSGKVYFDLLSGRAALPAEEGATFALVRVEELYPFPAERLAQVLRRYPQLTSVTWVQEETRNQGAWHFVRDDLQALLPASISLREVSRTVTAAGATASAVVHKRQQAELVARAFSAT